MKASDGGRCEGGGRSVWKGVRGEGGCGREGAWMTRVERGRACLWPETGWGECTRYGAGIMCY